MFLISWGVSVEVRFNLDPFGRKSDEETVEYTPIQPCLFDVCQCHSTLWTPGALGGHFYVRFEDGMSMHVVICKYLWWVCLCMFLKESASLQILWFFWQGYVSYEHVVSAPGTFARALVNLYPMPVPLWILIFAQVLEKSQLKRKPQISFLWLRHDRKPPAMLKAPNRPCWRTWQ